MRKNLSAALRGFLFGYVLGFLLIFFWPAFLWFRGAGDVRELLNAARDIFFSEGQELFLWVGALSACYCVLSANGWVRWSRGKSGLQRWLEDLMGGGR
jgi:hypothetical protein